MDGIAEKMDGFAKKIKTSISTQIWYVVGGIIGAIVLIAGLFGLSTKSNNYGKNYIIPALIFYTLVTTIVGSCIVYVVKGQIMSPDPKINRQGILTFITAVGVLLMLGGAAMMYIVYGGQGIIQTQGFNYFASVLIFQFCLMTAIVVVTNKYRTL
jgi:hypothetical protein